MRAAASLPDHRASRRHPEPFRAALGDRVFGCDACQEVCPWNRPTPAPSPANATLDLLELLALDADAFRARFRRTRLWRAAPAGLARNAAVVLGNLGDPAARPALRAAAAHHPSPLVREHAAWALRGRPRNTSLPRRVTASRPRQRGARGRQPRTTRGNAPEVRNVRSGVAEARHPAASRGPDIITQLRSGAHPAITDETPGCSSTQRSAAAPASCPTQPRPPAAHGAWRRHWREETPVPGPPSSARLPATSR